MSELKTHKPTLLSYHFPDYFFILYFEIENERNGKRTERIIWTQELLPRNDFKLFTLPKKRSFVSAKSNTRNARVKIGTTQVKMGSHSERKSVYIIIISYNIDAHAFSHAHAHREASPWRRTCTYLFYIAY